MKDVIILMTSYAQFGFAGVVGVTDKNGALVGIITDGDLRRHIHANPMDHKASDVMTKNPRTIASGTLAAEALAQMNDARITCLFVLDEEGGGRKPMGLITIHDCLRAGLR